MPFVASPPKKIKSPAEMAACVAEVARVDQHAEEALAAAKKAKAEVDAELHAQLTATLESGRTKKKITLAEYRQQLVRLAEQAAVDNPELAAADGKKSRIYPAGSVGFEKIPDAIALVDPEKRDKVAGRLGKKIKEALAKIVPWKSAETATAAAIVKSIKVQKGDTLAVEFDPKKLTAHGKALGMAGYDVVEGEDVFKVRPHKQKVD